MIERALAAGCAAAAVLLLAVAIREWIGAKSPAAVLSRERGRWAMLIRRAIYEGEIDNSFGSRQLLGASLAVGGIAGFALAGPIGVFAGALAAPFAARALVRGRRRRRAARIDASAADFAQALASSLAAGRSVRAALLTVGASTPQPLSRELDRAVVNLALGGNVADALADLRSRTGSARIEAMAGAIELHRGSGGDLVKLMRELAEAFRDRDRALRDAHTASAQARFTAYVVAAIPLVVALLLELAAPGAVTGAISLLPTALMLTCAAALVLFGVVLAQRLSTVRA